MVLVTSNKKQRLLVLNYIQRVVPAELESATGEIETLMAELPSDFRMLVDFSALDSMDPECAIQIGRTMDSIAKHEVGLILRVIPDPSKDIGFNILTIFHYPRQPRIINCSNMAEALQKLAQWS
jgi:anti-anti-sigma regulatory factor